ncbi:response regulator [Psychrosphaera haliotis]|uniref:Response regulator n=1 Tax=Psychrosphaera haliotis TaxID=555083 RepID=A0A6N8F967_9GAMM|nr:response regulator transcription factor [Psychrosphaera haliotis]MUH72973.1 response regulator [Psychrosphaera haliotis]
MAEKKKVVLVDDHHLVRAGLRALLEDLNYYEVVAEGADGSEVLALIEKTNPDVVILDIAMKIKSGLDALIDIKALYPTLPVILLTMHNTSDYLQTAIERGASAYLLKDSAEVELELALNAVLKNEIYISPKLSEQLLETLNADRKSEKVIVSKVLTPRQTEILKMLADGKGTKEIAFDLGLSVKTIESHRSQIMERLQIRDLASLVRFAIKNGVTTL